MEKSDAELLSKLIDKIPSLDRLHKKHKKLEKDITHLSSYSVYSPSTKLKNLELKKQKLVIMEAIMAIIQRHRANLGEVGR